MITRRLAALGLALTLSACVATDESGPKDLGDFRLGYNIVQARTVKQGPFSREISDEQLTTALREAVGARLNRYDGDGLYHVGISIAGFVLAQPGIPLVYTPKSVLIFEVNIYDNATGQRLNAEPKQITAFEGIENVAPIVGSGIVRGPEEQLANLVAAGAIQVERWLAQNAEWFTPEPGQKRVEIDRAQLDARAEAAVRSSMAVAQPVN
ncbi:hypothetical protein [Palleronia sp.]|uniref:hypothetical protein n=1 Tax=Palleronia sp. TaxID=1940284 RepID=UPI0035C78E87